MTEHHEHDEHPELLLAGADRPRPLSPALRARLEGALALGAAPADHADHARALSDEVRDRLESSLRPQEGRPRRAAGKWKALGASAGAAAVIVVVAAVVVPGLVHSPRVGGPPGGQQLAVRAPHRAVPDHELRSPKALNPYSAPRGGGAQKSSPAKRAKRLGQSPVPRPEVPTVFAPAAAAGAPVVDIVKPPRGPARGGNWVIVDGHGMAGVNAVYFGSSAAARVRHISQDEVEALAPAHSPGAVDIVVVQPGARSAVSPHDRYLFLP